MFTQKQVSIATGALWPTGRASPASVLLVLVLRCVAARATQAIPEYTSKYEHEDRRKEEDAASAREQHDGEDDEQQSE